MHGHQLNDIATLTDHDLLDRIARLARQERLATVELIVHLAELDKRKLYRGEGYGSLFSYCTDGLRLSEHAAYNRIEAARACSRFPMVLDLLAEGALNLTTVRLLAPHLTPANHEGVLADARGRPKREVEVMAARLAPRPDVPASVRRLPVPALVRPSAEAPGLPLSLPIAAPRHLGEPSPAVRGSEGSTQERDAPLLPSPRTLVAPLTPERYRIQFTVGRETQEKLRRAQDLLRREVPNGDLGAIFDRALSLLLEDVARRKLAATAMPRAGRRGSSHSRRIPAEIKRRVWIRDHGRCAFASAAGLRCRERTFLEFHHVEPYAIGGEATVANISLRCREHNVHEAELAFGPRKDRAGPARDQRSPAGVV